MEVPGPGVKLELQLPAYTTATATLYLSHVYDLSAGSFKPLREARDRTYILMETTLGL